MKKLTQEEFIARSIEVHGDKYSYDKVEYVNSTTRVVIICKNHGEFLQTPAVHLYSKAGCPTCNQVTKDEFLRRALAMHGDKYDYSKIVYVNANTPIELECPFCGKIFKQTPSHHMEGKNCSLCKNERIGNGNRKDTSYFIEKAVVAHGEGRYDYSLVDYESSRGRVKIICPSHGEFLQIAGDHLQGYGCPLCANDMISKKKLFSKEQFLEKAVLKHGQKYDYSLVNYRYSSEKVKIVCPEHGVFLQAPSQHWAGCGCPTCAKYGFDITQKGVLYVFQIEGKPGVFTGYGITRDYKTRLVSHKRFLRLSGYSICDAWVSDEVPGEVLWDIEGRVQEVFDTSHKSKSLEGFRTESTDAAFHVVVSFIEQEMGATFV